MPYCFVGRKCSAEAMRVCRLNVAPAIRTCTLSPSRHTGESSPTCPSTRTRIRGVDHGDTAAALDFERVVRADERRGVFVQADADRERVVGQRGEQAAEPVALAEMLVDHETVGQAQSRRQAHAARGRRTALLAERDHVFAEDAGAGAGAAHVHAVRIARADQFGDGRAAEHGREAQLVAAGKEDAAGLLEAGQAVVFIGITARIEVHRCHPAGAELGKHLLVARPGIGQLAGRRDHHDIGIAAATKLDKALQDPGIVQLLLGTTNRNDPAPLCTVGGPARAHSWLRAVLISALKNTTSLHFSGPHVCHAGDQYVAGCAVGIQCDQVCVGAGRDPALARQAQQLAPDCW